MPFSYLTDKDAKELRITIGIAYGFLLYTSLAAMLATPETVWGPVSDVVFILWALLASVASVAGITACVTNNWRIERWASWLAIGAVAAYAFIVLGLILEGAYTRQMQLGTLLSSAALWAYRARELMVRARKQHEEMLLLTAVTETKE